MSISAKRAIKVVLNLNNFRVWTSVRMIGKPYFPILLECHPWASLSTKGNKATNSSNNKMKSSKKLRYSNSKWPRTVALKSAKLTQKVERL